METITLIQVNYNGDKVVADWIPYTATPVDSYQMVITPQNGAVISHTINEPYASKGEITLQEPLDTNQSYSFYVTALNEGYVAAGTPIVTLITQLPKVTLVLYDGESVTAQWNPMPATSNPIAGFTLAAAAPGGNTVFSTRLQDGSAASGRLSFAEPLDTSQTWEFVVAANAAMYVSASSSPITMLVKTPTGLQADYNGASIRATWSPVTGATPAPVSYELVYYGEDQKPVTTPINNAFASGGSIELATELSRARVYHFQVRAKTSGPAASGTAPVELITRRPTVAQAMYDGTTVTADWVTPEGSGTPIESYQVQVSSPTGGPVYTQPIDNPNSNSGSVEAANLSNAAVWNLSIIAVTPNNISATGPPLTLITAKPTVSATEYDGANAMIEWGSITGYGITGYEYKLFQDDTELENTRVEGNPTKSLTLQGYFKATLGTYGAYSMKVQATGDRVYGPISDPMALITASPIVTLINAFSDNVKVTLDITSTKDANGVAGYQADIYQGETLLASAAGTDQTLTFDQTLDVQYAYHLRARAVGTNAASQTGPRTPPARLITGKPTITYADYDGTDISLSWTAVPDDALTGYAVHLWQVGEKNQLGPNHYTDSLSISFPWTLELDKNYSLQVRPLGSITRGRYSDPADPLADSRGWFLPAKADSDNAYLFRGDIRAPGPAVLTYYLPNIFEGDQPNISTAPFTISKINNNAPAGLPYQLTIAQTGTNNPWTFSGPGIRAGLQTAYTTFLGQVANASTGLKNGGLSLVRQVIGAGMPETFAEVLYYNLGLEPGKGYIDLLPGMRLRVDYETYQMVSNAQQDRTLNGYSGTGSSFYDLGTIPTSSGYAVSFESFLSCFNMPSVTPNAGGGGGVIDLQGSQYQLPFFRLFYPPTFPSSDSGGAVGTAQNAAIVGATTYDVMQQATTQFLAVYNVDGVTGAIATYLRGRATPIPELRVTVNGAPLYVPAGTTLRQVAQRFQAGAYVWPRKLSGLVLTRAMGAMIDVLDQVADSAPFNRREKIYLNLNEMSDYIYDDGLDLWDLPLLIGDALDYA